MSYYLIGGNKKDESSKVLGLNVNGEINYEFNDISDIDLQTTLIPRKDFTSELSKNNIEFDKSKDSIFLVQFPFTKTKEESKLYYTIKDFESEKTHGFIKNLRVFAQERSEQAKNNDKLILEPSQDFKDFAYQLMDDIIDEREKCYSKMKTFFGDQTLVLKYLKDKFDIIYKTYYPDVINEQRDKILIKLQDYKALRNLVLEYSLYLENENILLRSNLMKFTKEERNGQLIGYDFINEAVKKYIK